MTTKLEWETPATRRFVKRTARRMRRRLGKQDLRVRIREYWAGIRFDKEAEASLNDFYDTFFQPWHERDVAYESELNERSRRGKLQGISHPYLDPYEPPDAYEPYYDEFDTTGDWDCPDYTLYDSPWSAL